MNKFMESLKKGIIFFFKNHLYVMIILFAIDMISKFAMESWLLSIPEHSFTVIENFFSFTLVYNPGSFSGFLGNLSYGTLILMLLSITGGGIAIYYLIKKWNKMGLVLKIGLYLLIPGCFGNMIDRFLKVIGVKPGVIDFLSFNLPIIGEFPVFNFADICLTIAMVVIIVGYLIDENKKEKQKKLEEEERRNKVLFGEGEETNE